MKRFIISLLLVCCYTVAFCQSPDASPVEAFSINSISEAVKLFVSYINWVFVLVFMLATWLINDPTDATNAAKWLTWLSFISRSVRSLIVGLLLIILFVWVFKYTGRLEIFKMFLSLLLGMVIYKFGINKIFAWLSARLGFKFE